VRINPIHIHINDPDFIDQIYAPAGKEKRNGDPWFSMATESGMMAWSTLQTMDHHQHHLRRSALSRFFSKASVQELESLISDKTDRLLQRLAQMYRTGDSVINVTHVIAALTMDIISSYSLGVDMGNLSREEWGRDWSETFPRLGTIRPWGRQFKSLTTMSLSIEPSIVRWFNPTAAAVAEKAKYPMEVIRAHIDRHEKDGAASKMATNRRTIFMEILDSSLPPHEKSIGRLNAEAFLLLGAGTDPTTRTLTVTMHHLLANPELLERLRDNLKMIMPRPDTPVTVAALEALPFFVRIA
jgi:cytochrome P450